MSTNQTPPLPQAAACVGARVEREDAGGGAANGCEPRPVTRGESNTGRKSLTGSVNGAYRLVRLHLPAG